jgi:hypothetical protein
MMNYDGTTTINTHNWEPHPPLPLQTTVVGCNDNMQDEETIKDNELEDRTMKMGPPPATAPMDHRTPSHCYKQLLAG